MDRSILDAAAEILASRGFEGLTMEEVARRAGVSKASVYRRFACRTDLLEAVCREFSPPVAEPPDTGEVRRDLHMMLTALADSLALTDSGRVVPALLAASATHAEARQAISRFTADRRARTRLVIERGIDREELPAGTDPNVISDLLVGAVVLHSIVQGERVGPDLVEDYLDAVLAHGTPRSAPAGNVVGSAESPTPPPQADQRAATQATLSPKATQPGCSTSA